VNSGFSLVGGMNLREQGLLLIYPRLRELPHDEWKRALDAARSIDFDWVEWIGIVAGTAFVTLLQGTYNALPTVWSLPALSIAGFLLALPQLLVFVGPFFLRRNRRGLDRELARRREQQQREKQGTSGKEI